MPGNRHGNKLASTSAPAFPAWVLTLPRHQVALGLALSYALAVALGLLIGQLSLDVSTIWPAAGIGLAAVLIWGYWLLPVILLVHIVTSLAVGELSLLPRLGMGLVATAEIGLAAWLLDRHRGGTALVFDLAGAARFAVVCLLLVPMCGALAASGWLWSIGIISGNAVLDVARNWWVAVALGIVCITPLVNSALVYGLPRLHGQRGEALAILTALLFPSGLLLAYQISQNQPVEGIFYAALPFVFWASVFLRETGAAAGVAVLSVLAVLVSHLLPEQAAPVWQSGAHIITFGLMALAIANAQSRLEQSISERAAERETTHRRQQSIARERDIAKAANRAKDDFLAAVSHDIRTPLTTVLGVTELLAESPLCADDARLVQTQRLAGRHLLGLIDDMLDLARLEHGRLEMNARPFDPRLWLKEIETVFQPQAQAANLVLRMETGTLPAQLRGDAARLRQILGNLVANAIRYTERGGVVVQVHATPQADASVLLHMSVEDTGIGFTAADSALLFEAFERGEARTDGGAGLGLTIARRLTEAMGGQIRMDSEPGLGSRFEVLIPFAQSESPPEPAALEAPITPRRLLLVEDLPENREILERQLISQGHQVLACGNADEALQTMQTQEFDAILLDLRLPGMDGFALARTLRSRQPESNWRLIAVTASATDTVSDRCIQEGFDALLTKPLNLQQLAWALEGKPSAADRQCGPKAGAVPAAGHLGRLSQTQRDKVLRRHQRTCREVAQILQHALSQHDHATVREAAHRLSGSAAMVGRTSLAVLAQQTENAARERGELEPARRLLAVIRSTPSTEAAD